MLARLALGFWTPRGFCESVAGVLAPCDGGGMGGRARGGCAAVLRVWWRACAEAPGWPLELIWSGCGRGW